MIGRGVNKKTTISPNLFSANLATGTNATKLVSPFVSIGSATLTSDTEAPLIGTNCLKIVTPGNAVEEGTLLPTILGLGANNGYIIVKAPLNATMRVNMYQGSGSNLIPFTGTGNWQKVLINRTATTADDCAVYVTTIGASPQTITYYLQQAVLRNSSLIGA